MEAYDGYSSSKRALMVKLPGSTATCSGMSHDNGTVKGGSGLIFTLHWHDKCKLYKAILIPCEKLFDFMIKVICQVSSLDLSLFGILIDRTSLYD